MSDGFAFKAAGQEDASNEIVVSFSAHWRGSLLNADIKHVFRKRVPKSFEPRLMYIYVGSPHSEIIGRAEINSIELLDFDSAVSLLESAKLTKQELSSYFGNDPVVGCYDIANIELAAEPLSLNSLFHHSGFHPPQSFVRASIGASSWLKTQTWTTK
ncbi:hypothetical protein [Hyphomonas sp. KY3]|jgi:predicted transcriptional regulator|uniref:hypothetical protein n=1 Tax=Hyphomonas sp. KY3 TaxID=2016196 RepID=UPI001A8EE854|nr:hypothetical protein [Hyphomonas sp. KY3]QSR22001.1 hypothetical protein CFA77_06800 [Hyphomonas sp. KY3]GJL86603.1 MAG: hypothetical protein DHS20C03_03120 [Minwuia thermotolerans]